MVWIDEQGRGGVAVVDVEAAKGRRGAGGHRASPFGRFYLGRLSVPWCLRVEFDIRVWCLTKEARATRDASNPYRLNANYSNPLLSTGRSNGAIQLSHTNTLSTCSVSPLVCSSEKL